MTDSTGSPPDDNATIEEVRQRRRELHHVLVDVEQAVAAPATGRVDAWAGQVAAGLDELRDALDLHLETTEGPGGLWEEIIDHSPRLAHAIQWLRDDHETLGSALADATARARRVAGPDDVEEVRTEVLGLLGAFSRHRHRGADLVYEAYNVDISSGD